MSAGLLVRSMIRFRVRSVGVACVFASRILLCDYHVPAIPVHENGRRFFLVEERRPFCVQGWTVLPKESLMNSKILTLTLSG